MAQTVCVFPPSEDRKIVSVCWPLSRIVIATQTCAAGAHRRGAFHSVDHLQNAIARYTDSHNTPQPKDWSCIQFQ